MDTIIFKYFTNDWKLLYKSVDYNNGKYYTDYNVQIISFIMTNFSKKKNGFSWNLKIFWFQNEFWFFIWLKHKNLLDLISPKM